MPVSAVAFWVQTVSSGVVLSGHGVSPQSIPAQVNVPEKSRHMSGLMTI